MQPPSWYTRTSEWAGGDRWIDTSCTAGTTAIWTRWVEGTTASTTSATGSASMVSEYFAETANSMTNVNARIWKLWATTNAVTNAWIPTCEIYTFERRIVQPSRPSIREANEAWAAAEGERKLARERAEMLLMENLMPAQREELKQNGYFTLRRIDEKGTRFYRIHRGRSRNVEQVTEEGRRIMTLCAHPHENVPDADTMLAQKLMLMANEQEFLRVANRS